MGGELESAGSEERVLHSRVLRKRLPSREDPWWWLILRRMCKKLVGLGEVGLLGINNSGDETPLEVAIWSRKPSPACEAGGGSVRSKGYRSVVLVDVAAFGRPVRRTRV